MNTVKKEVRVSNDINQFCVVLFIQSLLRNFPRTCVSIGNFLNRVEEPFSGPQPLKDDYQVVDEIGSSMPF
jgi:hypothetical protein